MEFKDRVVLSMHNVLGLMPSTIKKKEKEKQNRDRHTVPALQEAETAASSESRTLRSPRQ